MESRVRLFGHPVHRMLDVLTASAPRGVAGLPCPGSIWRARRRGRGEQRER